MKIAITSASGQLGTSIAQATLSLIPHTDLVALARTPERAQHLGVEVRPGDYNDAAMLEQSLQGIDTVLLVSGNEAPDKRIDQHRNVIKAAQNSGVKKVVYTSVQGADANTAFSPIIQSNRQTEDDVKASGLAWVIGRNGIYIEPDVEYIEEYKKAGGIFNCADTGKCGYTTRSELAYAYAKMLTENTHNGQTYNLNGEALSQAQLAQYMNEAFGTSLSYHSMTVAEYQQERITALGEFMGTIIAGIYEGIREGKADNPSDFAQAAGREHQSWSEYFASIKSN